MDGIGPWTRSIWKSSMLVLTRFQHGFDDAVFVAGLFPCVVRLEVLWKAQTTEVHVEPDMAPDADVDVEAPLLVDQGYELDCCSQNDEELVQSGDDEDDLGVESLDYDAIHNVVHDTLVKKRHSSRRIYGYTGLTLAKWTITIAIGLLVGLIAFIIESSQEGIIASKREWTETLLERGMGLYFLSYAATSMALVLLSSCLVIYWAPAAAGGGVTLVMAYLNGNDIPDFFRHRTLLTKILGTIGTVSSGLPIGQEGPMVHIGGAIASELTWMHGQLSPTKKHRHGEVRTPQTWQEQLSRLRPTAWVFELYNDKDRREFISAGAAAGLAAAFGAPIGGVLFSMEEASSFWSRKVMWRSLLCTTCATMVLSWLNERKFSFLLPGTISFQGLKPEFGFIDLPLFVITSVSAGVIGAFLNICHDGLARFRPSSKHRALRVLEACLVTFIAIIVIFMLPYYFGHCLPFQKGQEAEEYWYKYTCPLPDQETGVHYYNDLASLYFAVPRQTIQQLLALRGGGASPFTIHSLAIHSSSFLLLFILAYGIATPGGIFMPSIMVGASFGACLGRIFELFFPFLSVQPGMHALVGATAMLGGVFRSSISLVVIMVEGTGGIEFLLPVILAIVISNWVAHHIHSTGAYESDLERIGEVHFLQSEPSQKLHFIMAQDIMAPDVICFREITSVAEVVEVLRETCHNGFPVIRHTNGDDHNPEGQLVGIMLRHQIMLLLEQSAFLEIDLEVWDRPAMQRRSSGLRLPRLTKEHKWLDRFMHVYHHTHNPHRRYLSSRPDAVRELEIDEVMLDFQDLALPSAIGTGTTSSSGSLEDSSQPITHQDVQLASHSDKELALDFRPWMNRAPLTVQAETSARRVYVIFRTLGLRHLCVTDACNRVVGMITRKDVAKTHKDDTEVVEPDTPREQPNCDYSQSSFGGKSLGPRSSLAERTAQDVLFSLA